MEFSLNQIHKARQLGLNESEAIYLSWKGDTCSLDVERTGTTSYRLWIYYRNGHVATVFDVGFDNIMRKVLEVQKGIRFPS